MSDKVIKIYGVMKTKNNLQYLVQIKDEEDLEWTCDNVSGILKKEFFNQILQQEIFSTNEYKEMNAHIKIIDQQQQGQFTRDQLKEQKKGSLVIHANDCTEDNQSLTYSEFRQKDDEKKSLKIQSDKNNIQEVQIQEKEKSILNLQKEEDDKEKKKKEKEEKEKKEKMEIEKIEIEKIEREKIEREKIEREKIEREKIEREKRQREKRQREKREREKREREKRDKDDREIVEIKSNKQKKQFIKRKVQRIQQNSNVIEIDLSYGQHGRKKRQQNQEKIPKRKKIIKKKLNKILIRKINQLIYQHSLTIINLNNYNKYIKWIIG